MGACYIVSVLSSDNALVRIPSGIVGTEVSPSVTELAGASGFPTGGIANPTFTDGGRKSNSFSSGVDCHQFVSSPS
jgi:hypothetical protein